MGYLWEENGWSVLRWDEKRLGPMVAEVRHQQGRLLGRMEGLGFELRKESVFRTLTREVVKTSEIEGEVLDVEQVRSSLACRLGMDTGAGKPSGREVDGIVEIVLDATANFDRPLTRRRLFGWHAALFPTGHTGIFRIQWLAWFLGCLQRAIAGSHEELSVVLRKARFWDTYARTPFNDRQAKVLALLLDGDFKGKLTSSKWARIARCSQDTAQRDIAALVRRNVLKRGAAGGRSTSYELGP